MAILMTEVDCQGQANAIAKEITMSMREAFNGLKVAMEEIKSTVEQTQEG